MLRKPHLEACHFLVTGMNTLCILYKNEKINSEKVL